MSTLHITRGLPSAGKSTWAKKWVAEDPERRIRVNRDDLRLMTFGLRNIFDIAGAEDAITKAQRAAVLALLDAGYDVVVDDTHMKVKYVRTWRKFVASHGHDFAVEDFPIDPELAIIRDAAREFPVGEAVIRRMAKYLKKGLLPVIPDEVEDDPARYYVPVDGAPRAAIIDVDGTVALMGARNPHDLKRVKYDAPNPGVITVVKLLRAAGVRIIFLSGREDTNEGQVRQDTEHWLQVHVDKTASEPLYMRGDGDMRRDSIVKIELFDAHVRDQYDVIGAWDDRNQVVKAWRGIGLTCHQVAEGDF